MSSRVPRIFISHSVHDRERIEREIIAPLQQHGLETWYARDSIPGAANWERRIRVGLEQCDWFLVALSPSSLSSEWVQTEVHWALENRPGRVVPVLLEPCDPTQAHLKLARIQHIDFTGNPKDAIDSLLAVWHKSDRAAPLSDRRFRFPRGLGVWIPRLLILSVVGALALWFVSTRRDTRSKDPYLLPTRVAVLYFDDVSPDQNLRHIASGLTESLIDELSHVRGVSVISRNGVSPFRNQSVRPDSIGRALQAGTLVSGSIARSDGKLRINVQLIDASTGETRATQVVSRAETELFGLIDDVVREVGGFLREHLGNQVRMSAWRAETRSEDAWELMRRAEELAQDASELEHSSALAPALVALTRRDSLLERAAQLDPAFLKPRVLQAWTDLARGMLLLHRDGDLKKAAERWKFGIDRATDILVAHPAQAEALEVRGVLHVFVASFMNDAQAARLARTDLEAAVAQDVTLASAWSHLSSLYQDAQDLTAARAAAEQAYRADAYLTDAISVLSRLFEITFEQGEDVDARRWCNELQRRFNDLWPSTYCRLMLMAWAPDRQPVIDSAWRFVVRAQQANPPHLFADMKPRLEAMVAAVIARDQQRDSAQAVLRRVKAEHPDDAELLLIEAGVRVLLGQPDSATRLLQRYVQGNPEQRRSVAAGRRFRTLDQTALPR